MGVSLVLCLFGSVFQVDDTLAPPSVAAYALAVVSCAALHVRHRAPLAAAAVTTGCGLLVAPLGLLLSPLTIAPVVVCAYSFALRADRRLPTTVLLPVAALLVVSTSLLEPVSWQDASRMSAVVAFPLVAGVLGYSARNRRAYLAAVEERALRAEESRDGEARRRVAEERVRIARELHDLVAHQITLANAQATVAAHVFDTRPEQTRTSLHQLVETTSNALDDLRATVGLLRQTDDAAAPTEPAPGLSLLATLVESFRRAGLEVSVVRDGPGRPLPPGVDLTAYRIVQEALTNVTKHAGTGTARVGLTWSRDRLTITVVDDGVGRRTASAGPDRPPGYGLIGMRERATAVGGRLSAGPRADVGFLVSADLPLPPTRDPARTSDGATAGGAP
ncbi:sensor histidine kinase [Nocardioides sp.]|uniref:sensor histidine kinase n=1 Tax=Nocardioides sp. TaxID=35761 RepID=UPI002720F0B0|nr:histidine kinase [Nocardioides sp.]MDO9457084.1 histidine kinase [Nocardioides sp.]